MLSNLTIKMRLIMLVSVIMTIGVAVGITTFIGFYNLQSATQDIAERRIHLIRTVNRVIFTMADERAQIMGALQHDPSLLVSKQLDHSITKHFEAIETNKSKLDEYFAALDKDSHSEAGRKILAELVDARMAYAKEALFPALQAIKAGKYDEAENLLLTKINPLLDSALSKGREMAEHEDEGAKKATEAAISSAHFSESLLVCGIFLMTIVGCGLGYSIIANLSRSTMEMNRAMTQTAADGDLTRNVEVFGKDEVAVSAIAYNSLLESFREVISHVHKSADSVTDTATQLSAASTQITQGSQAQSEAAASTAAAVEEMTVSITSVSSNTNEVRELSKHSLDKTREGNRTTSEMLKDVNQIKSTVNQIADAVSEFIVSARTIAGMTQQVRDIADQTNLLALNAAIEAARAGEQGRGFAVVADEVRKLAEKSAQSASEIDRITHSLENQSASVEKSVKDGLCSLDATQQHVDQVAAVLQEAGGAVERSSAGVNDIAAAVAEQSLASNEIARHVESIAQMAEENHAAIAQSEEGIINLSKLAKDLQSTVIKFKI